MAKKSKWKLNLDGNEYHLSLKKSMWSGKMEMSINETPISIKAKGFSESYVPFERTFSIEGHQGIVVIDKDKICDVVIDGISTKTNEAYIPCPPLAKWAWVFIIACAAIPIVTLGGALPAVLGLGGAAVCGNIAKSTMFSTLIKIILCTVVTGGLWFVLLIGLSARFQ